VVGDTIDFSSQAMFNYRATNFKVEKDKLGGTLAIINVDYTENNGIIVFNKSGNYFITMTNSAITSAVGYDAVVYAEFNVRDANTDATLYSLNVSTGILNPIFNPTHYNYTVNLKNNVRLITLSATPNDSNATVIGDGQKQLYTDTNEFIIAVTAEDGITTLNYTVTVINESDVGIAEITNYELQITNYEIYDIMGRKVLEKRVNSIILDELRDVNLPQGFYILRMQTDKGIITKKVTKK